MKNQKTVLSLVGGTVLGFTLAFCLGAASKAPDKASNKASEPDAEKEIPAAQQDSPPLQVVSYPNGGTGFFDPETSTMYVYDSKLQNCYMIRQIETLGEAMITP